MNEEWIRWNPKNLPEKRYYVTTVIQDLDGTRIVLDDDENIKVVVNFDGFVPITRLSDEGLRMRTWGEVQLKYKNKAFFVDWFLYKVENSKFVQWAKEESCGLYDEEMLQHYCIVTSNEIIDILSSFEPIIEVEQLNDNKE